MEYDKGPYKAPPCLLKDIVAERVTPKSQFLIDLEAKQAKTAKPKRMKRKPVAMEGESNEDANRSRRVVSLRTAFARRRD